MQSTTLSTFLRTKTIVLTAAFFIMPGLLNSEQLNGANMPPDPIEITGRDNARAAKNNLTHQSFSGLEGKQLPRAIDEPIGRPQNAPMPATHEEHQDHGHNHEREEEHLRINLRKLLRLILGFVLLCVLM